AVIFVEAFAAAIVRVVVICLESRNALLVEQVGNARVVSDHEVDVVLVVLRIREQYEVDPGGPGRWHRERVTRHPRALDKSRAGVDGTGGLLTPTDRPNPLHETAAQALIPADSIDVHRVRLGGIHADIERDRFTFVHAGRRGVALDLFAHIVSRLIARSRELPLIGARLLVLEDNRVSGGRRSRSGADRETERKEKQYDE